MSDCCSHSPDSASPGTAELDASRSPESSCCAGGTGSGERGSSDASKRFQEFLRTVNQPGALDARTKQAISIALSVLAKCEPCVRHHLAKAREKGFTPQEIDEAAWMAISFGGAPLMMFYEGMRRSL